MYETSTLIALSLSLFLARYEEEIARLRQQLDQQVKYIKKRQREA